MKILHVLPTLHRAYGGPVKVVQHMQNGLEKLGHEVKIFPQSEKIEIKKEISNKYLYWPGIKGIYKMMHEIEQADLVHIHGLWTLTTSIAASIAAYGED